MDDTESGCDLVTMFWFLFRECELLDNIHSVFNNFDTNSICYDGFFKVVIIILVLKYS